MERDRFPLGSSREPNPLRPYYIPPSTGFNANIPSANATTQPTGTSARTAPATTSGVVSSTARDVLPQLDLDLAGSTSEAWQHTRRLLDTLAWRYTSVVLAQPFDVAKTLLQISLAEGSSPSSSGRRSRGSAGYKAQYRETRHTSGHRDELFDDIDEEEDVAHDDDESDDIPDYFTSSASRSRSPRKRRRTPPTSLSPSPTPTPKSRQGYDPSQDYKLRLKRLDSINHVLSALHTTSGVIGWWRATNCTFLYSILLRTTDSFIRSLLLAIFGLPEILSPEPAGLGPNLSVNGAAGFSGLDLAESPSPLSSLVVVGLSSCIAGLLLTPLDMVRTRLIVTPNDHAPRGLVQNLRRLPSLVAPSLLWLPTALLHTLPQVFSASAPLVLRRNFRITPETTPSAWSFAAFTTSLVDLFLRLPLETVVRRAQVTSLRKAEPELPMIVEPANYTGVWATVYGIMYTEGEVTTKDTKGMLRTRRGCGGAGLIRGWRIGFWGLVGVWGAGAIGPGDGNGRGRF